MPVHEFQTVIFGLNEDICRALTAPLGLAAYGQPILDAVIAPPAGYESRQAPAIANRV